MVSLEKSLHHRSSVNQELKSPLVDMLVKWTLEDIKTPLRVYIALDAEAIPDDVGSLI